MSDVPLGLVSLVLKEKKKKKKKALRYFLLFLIFFSLSLRTLDGNYYSRSQAGSVCWALFNPLLRGVRL